MAGFGGLGTSGLCFRPRDWGVAFTGQALGLEGFTAKVW